ncbi:unnamed protein product [Polarella glacialis]|uniref:Uncharacterized protein n=1 Tax=Polarella glacialis TaxID=89957 RepID=A0A813HS89_POLGL|nr:unnamed protein product [Polarella glacialis]
MGKKRKKELQEEGPPDASLAEINQVLLSNPKQLFAPVASGYDGAKLALELLEAAATQLLRRKGWFRDVRLRRSADAFMKSSKLHQRASARLEDGKGFEKPTPAQMAQYEEDLAKHLESVKGKIGSVPMNVPREISLKTSGPGKVIGAKLKELKERAVALDKNPRSVIKASVQKKRKGKALASKAPKAAGDDDL